ncbi:DIS3-like exonuclease 2 [Zophobas morio]|uniref:DIS3-like exonuclease 2 n=1 Tax=Zophobas morio TaxID=2755281 RepID=UPI003083B28A
MLYSTDKRVPRIFINHSSLWKELLDEQGHHLKKAYFNNYLFLVEIVFWNTDSLFPSGKVVKMLGRGCCIETETEALKLDYSVPSEVWDAGVTACLPCLPWTIPASEYQLREDLRKDCIFTVDPATARDLDDALSITETPDGCCIVGVHIADVSYFVTPDTPLDLEARHRACTVYLVQQSFCMLPRLLSEDVCSLLPGRDRLAVSLFWKLNAQAEVLAHWSRRSVVHSCCQLSYDDAQMIIDLKTDAPLRGRVTHGEHTLEQIAASIIKLNALAAHLQAQRIKNGSLHLDFPKLDFELDKLGHPVSVQRHETCAARCMVSEFMILANATVANILRDNFPDQAFLRAHSAPEDGRLCKVASFLENYNIHIDGTSSASLLSSLDCLQKRVGSDLDSAELDLVIYYLIKPMQTARYVCPEAEYYRELKARAYKVWATRDQEGPPHENWFDFFTDSWGDQHIQALVDYLAKHGVRCTSEPMTAELLRHYSLALPMYTHFTSPIRRYADIITHRMLLSATEGTDFGISTCELSKLAEHCNRRRLLVSDAQLQSNRVFLGAFIARRGPLRVNGIVASIYDKSFDVFIPAYGLESRVNICEIPHLLSSELKDGYLLFTWKSGSSGFILLESINLKRVSEILNKKFGFCDVSQDGPVQTIIPFTQLQLECSCDLSKPHMDINVIPVVQRQEHA